MFQKKDLSRNEWMLDGSFAEHGYDWWWHNFTGINKNTGEEKSFFIEFFTCNPALSVEEPILGQTEQNQWLKVQPSYLMVKAGAWGNGAKQLHRFFSLNDVNIQPKMPFSVSADDCLCSDFVLRGSVNVTEEDAKNHPEMMSDAGSMSWDLSIDKQIAFNVGYGASALFRKLKAFEMYWHAEGMKTKYRGTVTYDGEEYEVIAGKSFGYADKNWGRNFTSPWVWLSSWDITSRLTGKRLKNTVFDIGGGRPKVYFVPLERKLLGALWYEGKEYEFNFSKFWMNPRTRFDFHEDETFIYWKVWQENATALIKVDIKCRKDEMLLVNYEDPDGRKRHNNLWNGGTGTGRIRLYEKCREGLLLIDDMDVAHAGCEYGEFDPE